MADRPALALTLCGGYREELTRSTTTRAGLAQRAGNARLAADWRATQRSRGRSGTLEHARQTFIHPRRSDGFRSCPAAGGVKAGRRHPKGSAVTPTSDVRRPSPRRWSWCPVPSSSPAVGRAPPPDPSLDQPCRPTPVMSCRARTRHMHDGTRRDGRMT